MGFGGVQCCMECRDRWIGSLVASRVMVAGSSETDERGAGEEERPLPHLPPAAAWWHILDDKGPVGPSWCVADTEDRPWARRMSSAGHTREERAHRPDQMAAVRTSIHGQMSLGSHCIEATLPGCMLRVTGEVCRTVSCRVHWSRMAVLRLTDSPEAGHSQHDCASLLPRACHIEAEAGGCYVNMALLGCCAAWCQQVEEVERGLELRCPIHADMYQEHHMCLHSAY